MGVRFTGHSVMRSLRLHSLLPLGLSVLLGGLPDAGAHAETAVVTVSAVVLSKNQCKLTSRSATLAFGTINPTSTANATASASIDMVCRGSDATASFSLDHDSGLHELVASQNRMRHATAAAYLPYQFSLSPASGSVARNVTQPITIGGTITPANFSNATPGNYSDTVTISLLP